MYVKLQWANIFGTIMHMFICLALLDVHANNGEIIDAHNDDTFTSMYTVGGS